MHTPDAVEFKALLGRLAVIFGKPAPADDVIDAYWSALKDLHFAAVKRSAEHHIRYGKFFPKPFELRPKEDKRSEETPSQRAAFDGALRENRQNWETWLAKEPAKARAALVVAYAARVEEQYQPGDMVRGEKLAFARENGWRG
jgi:hypothetical protein